MASEQGFHLLGLGTKVYTAQDIVDEYFAQPLVEKTLTPEVDRSNELNMARALVGYQCHVGGEIRSIPGRQFEGDTWPRHGLPAAGEPS